MPNTPSIASQILDHYNGVKPILQPITADDRIPFDPAPSPRKPKRQPSPPIHMTESMLKNKEMLANTLRKGAWMLDFTKVDGTPSTMECTLDPELLPQSKTDLNPTAATTGRAAVAEHLLHVYAIDRNGWRSFVVPNVTKIYKKVQST